MKASSVVARFVFAILPMPAKRIIAKRVLGWDIHKSATIGISLVMSRNVSMGRNARIGHFNVFRDLETLSLDEGAHFGQWNWVSAAVPLTKTGASESLGRLMLGREAAVTSRHYMDCSGGISIGPFSTIAGVRSTILTHQIDVYENRQTVAPVVVGDYCFVGSDVRIVSGSCIPNRCVIAMGAVVAAKLEAEDTLYGGVPARAIKPINGSFFSRAEGHTA